MCKLGVEAWHSSHSQVVINTHLVRDLFQKLFRQDLLVASLFRNFLLAERIMRSYDCTPVSSPKLPPTYQIKQRNLSNHPMWQAWDLALDLCLAQLPAILDSEDHFVHSPFFEEQLTAFQVWLTLGSELRSPPEQLPIVLQVECVAVSLFGGAKGRVVADKQRIQELDFILYFALKEDNTYQTHQWPYALVLLSQVHRLRALELLGRFLDLGPWAVNLALSVGIFPYVLKLLQSSAKELRPLLVFIWAKILAVDSTCQADLVRDNGHKYFLSVLQDPSIPGEHRTLAAFVLASIVHNYPAGQEVAMQGSLVSICLEQLQDPNPLLRQWLAVCLGRLWMNYDKARWCGVRDIAHEKLYTLLQDPVPEVRAAAVYALGTFISSVTERSEHANNIDHSIAMTLINTVTYDMSPLVRKELVVALQWMVLIFENSFLKVALQEEGSRPTVVNLGDASMSPLMGMRRIASRDRLKMLSPGSLFNTDVAVSPASDVFHSMDKIKRVSSSSSISHSSLPSLSYGSIYMKLWHGLATMDLDPHHGVRHMSRIITSHVRDQGGPRKSNPPPISSRRLTLNWRRLIHFHPYCDMKNEQVNCLSKALLTYPHVTTEGLAISQRLVFQQLWMFVQVKESSAPKELGETKLSSSLSLPPSPSSRPSFLAGESPPTTGSVSELHRLTSSRSAHLTSRTRKIMPNTISEEADDTCGVKQPLVTTQFVEWSCKYFAQPVMKFLEDNDIESSLYYEREWRYQRNFALRQEAKEEQSRISTGKLEHQVFNTRSPQPPSVIRFHPYETHIVVAGRDSFGIWDWLSGSKLNYCNNRASRNSRITSLDFINNHDSNYVSKQSQEPVLVTAWQALSDVQPVTKSPTAGAGMVSSWDQRSQRLVVSGDVRVIRLWDADTELKIQDIPTGAECCVTSIATDLSVVTFRAREVVARLLAFLPGIRSSSPSLPSEIYDVTNKNYSS
uniref:Regulatory-associated protein of mTOR n=1 Tax=Timema bartmani TaxID=61472 RepID=A0A7R9F1W8_9NEOP|nr:unnamed protein product [Timema bartmani]